MRINTANFLTHYPGSEALPLRGESPFTDDPRKTADYNRFIENISTIYGSQDSEGNIPLFWTVFSGTKYVPNPESTLTQLDPRRSYYFITRDEASLPLNLPINGKVLAGYRDQPILPQIKTTLTDTFDNINDDQAANISALATEGVSRPVLTTNNYAYLKFKVDGLQPFEDYDYTINCDAANWPVSISPISGVIKPSQTDEPLELSSVVHFIKSTGTCGDQTNIATNSLDCADINSNNLYAVVNLEITPQSNTVDSVKGDNITIRCKDCIPRLTVQLPDIGILSSINSTASSTTNSDAATQQYTALSGTPASGTSVSGIVENLAPVSGDNRFFSYKANIQNIETKKRYTYEYRSLEGNWPARLSTPMSGSLSSLNPETVLNSSINFCLSTGLCPENGALSYNLASGPDLSNLFTTVELVISSEDGTETAVSNPFTVYCQDCL